MGIAPIPLELGAVQVVVRWIPPLHAGVIERLLHHRPLIVLAPLYRDRTVVAVEIILDVKVGLRPAVVGQDIQVAPFLVAEV